MRDVSVVRLLTEVPASSLRQIDARVKVGLAMVLVLLLSAIREPQGFWPFERIGLLLFLFTMVGRVPLTAVLVRLLPLLPFVIALVFVPFLQPGTVTYQVLHLPPVSAEGLNRALTVLARMLSIGGTMALLSATTSFDEILRAMRAFRVPAGIVVTLGFMFRYLFLLLEEGQRMGRAHAARGGDWRPSRARRQSIGSVVAVLFIRAHDRGERVHRAMVARGFDEVLEHPAEPGPPGRHVAVATLSALLAAGLIWWGG